MNLNDVLDKILCSFQAYYNIKREVESPFTAEAEFISHNEQYFLIKKAKVAEINSNEHVFFYASEALDVQVLQELDECAWNRGLSRVKPDSTHRNTDVTLIIVADYIQPEAMKLIPRLKHYKSYLFTLHGWSNYRLIAVELSSGNLAYNRQGQSLKKLVSNILK